MKYRSLVALAVLAVFLLGAQHLFGHELNTLFLQYPGIDKVLHVVGYAWVFALAHAGAGIAVPARTARLMIAAIVGLGLALADEGVQRLVPGRDVDGMDLLADLSGLMLGWAIADRQRRGFAAATACLAVVLAGYLTWNTHVLLIDYARALRVERQGDFVRAREHYDRAYRAGLRSAGLFNGMAWAEVESGVGDPRAAVGYAEQALAMEPDNPDILDTYGWALHKAGRSADALVYLRRALAAKPDMFCIHYHLGEAYLATNQRELAREHLRLQMELRGTREAEMAARALLRTTNAQ